MSMKKMLAVVAAVSLVAAPAFAANPFSDVPMNHWAYDAVEQLSAKGILEGYPNGTFKGNKSMTRYEIATMVARMMANGGASGADLEKLKALVVEFQPELEALGVKVDGFDARISKLEKGLGGWKLSGQLRWDMKNFNKRSDKLKNGWYNTRARLFLHKDLSDGVSFDARWHGGNFDRWWVTAKDTFGVKGLTTRLGQFYMDWEGQDGLYWNGQQWDDDALFQDGTMTGINMVYKTGALTLDGFYSSRWSGGSIYASAVEGEFYGARVKYGAAKWFLSANAQHYDYDATAESHAWEYWQDEDKGQTEKMWQDKVTKAKKGAQYDVYSFVLGLKPMKGLDLVGAYYMEKVTGCDDDPKGMKVALTLDKSLLKFTKLRAEYLKLDKGFMYANGTGPLASGVADPTYLTKNKAIANDVDMVSVKAKQDWTKKFFTYERWGQFDMDNAGKAKQLQFGVGYQYSPNLLLQLDWTKYDGKFDGANLVEEDNDKVIRLRTFLSF